LIVQSGFCTAIVLERVFVVLVGFLLEYKLEHDYS
jgi:hypothetical protein